MILIVSSQTCTDSWGHYEHIKPDSGSYSPSSWLEYPARYPEESGWVFLPPAFLSPI